LITSAVISYAQKTDKNNIDIEIEMSPRMLISKDKGVNIEVTNNYTELVNSRRAEVDKLKSEQANKGTGTKLLEHALKKRGYDPKNPTPESIFIPTLVGEELVPQIQVPGFTENNLAKGRIKIVFYPLEISNQTASSFYYQPLKADVTIVNDKGANIYQAQLGNIKGANTYNIPPTENLQESYFKAEAKAKKEAIDIINNLLKTEFGYVKLKDSRRFFDVKDKKHQYPEYHSTLEKIKSAMAYISIPSKKQEVEKLFQESINVWEQSIKELDKNNKDAKITKNIAAATYLNIAEANIWLHSFEKSESALAEYKLLDEDYSNAADDIKKLLADYSARYNSWVNY
jgi:hypothetical protein